MGDDPVDQRVKPGATFYVDFPQLAETWKKEPARMGVYIPKDYTLDRSFSLLVWFGGGSGTDNPRKAVAIAGENGFVCLAVPYRSQDDGKSGGWETPWAYYKTFFDELDRIVPNINTRQRICSGFSSGGAAIMYQIGNSGEAFQKYFYAFIPGGAGWPMGGLSSIKGRPMLAVMGEKDKRLPNYQTLEKEARAAGIDIELLLFKDVGHKYPEKYYPQIRKWMIRKAVLRDTVKAQKAKK